MQWCSNLLILFVWKLEKWKLHFRNDRNYMAPTTSVRGSIMIHWNTLWRLKIGPPPFPNIREHHHVFQWILTLLLTIGVGIPLGGTFLNVPLEQNQHLNLEKCEKIIFHWMLILYFSWHRAMAMVHVWFLLKFNRKFSKQTDIRVIIEFILVLSANISGPQFSIDGTELSSTDLIDDDIDTCVELTGNNGCPPNKVIGLTLFITFKNHSYHRKYLFFRIKLKVKTQSHTYWNQN